MTGAEAAVFIAVIAGRFLIPLLILRCPLPAIVAALVLDGVDQTIFQSKGYDSPGYQGHDKAMDVFYLAIAQLDVTDELAAHSWLAPVIVVVLATVLYAVCRLLIPRLGPMSWPWRVVADPLPDGVDEVSERAVWTAANARVWSIPTLEKVLLVGLISAVFGQVLPGLRSTGTQLFIGLAVIVLVNAAMALAFARAGRSIPGATVTFGVRVAANVALVVLGGWLLGRNGGDGNGLATLFFILLLSLITSLHDRYWPVHSHRSLTAASASA